jgi:hypothetical protein
MKTQTVTLGDVTLTVSEATVRMGTARARARLAAFDEPDAERRALLLEHADLVSVTTQAEGIPWPLTPEQLADLPETLALKWERAVYALNPHWYERDDAGGTSEKKDAPSGAIATPSIGV